MTYNLHSPIREQTAGKQSMQLVTVVIAICELRNFAVFGQSY